MGGAKGNYILTTWKDGGKDMEKHTAQHLKDGHRYMVVMWGEKGKTDKKVFDNAVKTFALGEVNSCLNESATGAKPPFLM